MTEEHPDTLPVPPVGTPEHRKLLITAYLNHMGMSLAEAQTYYDAQLAAYLKDQQEQQA